MAFNIVELVFLLWIFPCKFQEHEYIYNKYISLKIIIFSILHYLGFSIFLEISEYSSEMKYQAKGLGYWIKISQQNAISAVFIKYNLEEKKLKNGKLTTFLTKREPLCFIKRTFIWPHVK